MRLAKDAIADLMDTEPSLISPASISAASSFSVRDLSDDFLQKYIIAIQGEKLRRDGKLSDLIVPIGLSATAIKELTSAQLDEKSIALHKELLRRATTHATPQNVTVEHELSSLTTAGSGVPTLQRATPDLDIYVAIESRD